MKKRAAMIIQDETQIEKCNLFVCYDLFSSPMEEIEYTKLCQHPAGKVLRRRQPCGDNKLPLTLQILSDASCGALIGISLSNWFKYLVSNYLLLILKKFQKLHAYGEFRLSNKLSTNRMSN
jgi:hypothetical protein